MKESVAEAVLAARRLGGAKIMGKTALAARKLKEVGRLGAAEKTLEVVPAVEKAKRRKKNKGNSASGKKTR